MIGFWGKLKGEDIFSTTFFQKPKFPSYVFTNVLQEKKQACKILVFFFLLLQQCEKISTKKLALIPKLSKQESIKIGFYNFNYSPYLTSPQNCITLKEWLKHHLSSSTDKPPGFRVLGYFKNLNADDGFHERTSG